MIRGPGWPQRPLLRTHSLPAAATLRRRAGARTRAQVGRPARGALGEETPANARLTFLRGGGVAEGDKATGSKRAAGRHSAQPSFCRRLLLRAGRRPRRLRLDVARGWPGCPPRAPPLTPGCALPPPPPPPPAVPGRATKSRPHSRAQPGSPRRSPACPHPPRSRAPRGRWKMEGRNAAVSSPLTGARERLCGVCQASAPEPRFLLPCPLLCPIRSLGHFTLCSDNYFFFFFFPAVFLSLCLSGESKRANFLLRLRDFNSPPLSCKPQLGRRNLEAPSCLI